MTEPKRNPNDVLASMIPVVVGAFIALISSLVILQCSTQAQLKETVRREHAGHIERATSLAARFLRELNSSIGSDVYTAPADTLVELETVVRLYFPGLEKDVDALRKSYDEFTSTAETLAASEPESTGVPNDVQAARSIEYRRRMDQLEQPVVKQTDELIDHLRTMSSQKF